MTRWLLTALLLLGACKSGHPKPHGHDAGMPAALPANREPKETFEKLAPLHPPQPPAKDGDWRTDHPEPKQSYTQYLWAAQRPVADRDTIYVVALGDFTPEQAEIVTETTRVLAPYFGSKVKSLAPIPASEIPDEVERLNPYTKDRQLYTVWVLEELLPRRVPKDGIALIALTAEDLFPDPKWNFVFGQANPADRVGVWSLARFGDLKTERHKVLRRLEATAVHEAGHLFGLAHCQDAQCVMNGANSLEEAERWPLEPCPVCLRKLQWRFAFDVRGRFAALRDLHTDAGLTAEAEHCSKALEALGPVPESGKPGGL